ncbi:MAG: malate synthase G, partial [Pseudomonadota bacterium]
MSDSRVNRSGLQVAAELDALVAEQIIPGTGVDVDQFWAAFAATLDELGPVNRELLARRAELQAIIDDYHLKNRGQALDPQAYKAFLTEIGYLLPEPADFAIE